MKNRVACVTQLQERGPQMLFYCLLFRNRRVALEEDSIQKRPVDRFAEEEIACYELE